MVEESQVADYFVVAGLPDDPEPMDDYSDRSHQKQNQSLAPITDITVIFPALNEYCPEGWQVLDHTPTGLMADLNYGSVNSSEVYVCYKRGRDKPPLVDIGVLYENKDRILPDSEIVRKTPTGKLAIVNTTTKTLLTFRRAREDMPANELVVTDICVIIASKGEKAPHAFCVIKKNLNKGIFGGEVYLCYKKSMNRANVISYKPGILCRYPLWDRTDWKLHSNVPLFCLPMGASLEVWPPNASQPPTVFSTFILTVSDAAEKVYGSAVTFYESYPVEKLTEEQLAILGKSLEDEKVSVLNSQDSNLISLNINETDPGKNNVDEDSTSITSVIPRSYTINVNKCICLLSHWPFFDTFETFLNFLYKLSISGPNAVPIERYISHFLENVPFPSPQRPRILVQLSAEERVILFQPEDLPLPRSGAGFRDLLLNLGSEDSLLVLLLVLTEHKILVHSLRPSILTAVVEAISIMIFPFKWQCPYIPLCPLGLAEVLHAPLPFLIGVDSRFFDMYDPPSDVTCVDLDTNNITVPEEKNLSYKLLPKRAARNLKNALEELYKKCCEEDCYLDKLRTDDDIDGMLRFQLKEREQKLQLEIQEAFLRFMATILKGYRSYLLPITKAPTVGTTDPNSLFDLQGFLKSRERAHHKFFMMLMRTQMFIRFIEERSFVSDIDAGLAFFDECTEKVDGEDGHCRLLDIEESHKSERTVFIPPPEPSGLPLGAIYEYQGFNLDNNLFRNKETKNTLNILAHENTPGSPMARRTKHEMKSAQKLARRKHSQSDQSWAKCLLTTCYSLWFIHLPSFVIYDQSKSSACLKIAYDLLVKIQKLKLHPTDEVCYRVMMQLFGIHSQPVLAVNLLSQMKMCGIQPNALTYGYYNRAVLEATWPSDLSNPSHLWNKLRNVIVGAALFRRGGHKSSRNKLPEAESCSSLASLERGDLMSEIEKFDRKRSNLGSIVKPHPKNLLELASHQQIESVAGILMTGLKKSSPIQGRRSSLSDFAPKLHQSPSIAAETNTSRLRRGSMPPSLPENKMLTILMRSDSFANDTSIVEKHNRSNKFSEKGKEGLAIPDTLFLPRESSESLDITDDLSLDDSWNSGRNSIQNSDIPSKNFISKLARLGTDVWTRSHWKTSQESVDSAPTASSEKLAQESEPSETDNCRNRKSSWKSSEELIIVNSNHNSPKILNKTKGNSTLDPQRSNLGATNSEEFKQDVNNLKVLTSFDNLLNSSENMLSLNAISNQNNVYCIANDGESRTEQMNYDKKLPNGELSLNESGDVSSPMKISPIRIPVTENDPLGALQSELNILKGNERSSKNEKKLVHNATEKNGDYENSKMKYDLDSYGLFSNYQGKKSKISDEGTERMNKINSRKKESGQVDSSNVSNRVPKSATFHHGKEKETQVNKVPRGNGTEDKEIISSRKAIQRSTTLPDAAAVAAVSSSPSVASSLSHLGSSLKFSFSRYSPSRFSLKKSDLRVAKTQILENAISGSKKSNELLMSGYNTFKSAASSFAKKIEEAISTNTTPVKLSNISHEYEEDESDFNIEKSSAIDFESWGTNLKEFFGDGSRKGSSANLQTQPSDEQNIPEDVIIKNLYGKNSTYRHLDGPVGIVIVMTSCCKCNNCNSLLHDEEIIAGWTPDDSNLNTKCHFCGKSTLPFLTITIYDYRGRNMKVKYSMEVSNLSHSFLNWQLNSSNSSVCNTSLNDLKEESDHNFDSYSRDNSPRTLEVPLADEESVSNEKLIINNNSDFKILRNEEMEINKKDFATGNNDSNNDADVEDKVYPSEEENDYNNEPYILEPINVPYLNPLVLRKELENILHHEGDPSLTKSSFVDQHPIIYWNMIWVFERINVTSHLPTLVVKSSVMNKKQYIHPSWNSKYSDNYVSIRCLWDNPRLHEEIGLPMYVLRQQQEQPSVLVNALVTERVTFSKSVIQNVIASLRCDNLCDPMRQLINERKKLRKKGFNHSYSLYRDILFLAIVACERTNIDLDYFDRQYSKVYDKLKAEGFPLLKCDKPPVSASYRNYFRPLLL